MSPSNAYHIYQGGSQHAGNGRLILDGGVTIENEEDPASPGQPLNPSVEGVVLAFGGATVVLKDAVFINYASDTHLDDYLAGGTVIDCAETPSDPGCN